MGTAFSAPIASGIAALVLSRNGNQNVSTVGSRLKTTCDRIGPVAYTGSAPNTRNDFYGHGRLNADAAVSAVTADSTSPQFQSATVINHRTVDVAFSEPMGEGVLDPDNYEITAGGGSLSLNREHVVRIGLVQVGFGAWQHVFRLIWTSGDIATSGTVTIAADSGIKNVAGNALTGTLSRRGRGTKRQIAWIAAVTTGLSTRPRSSRTAGFKGMKQPCN